MKYLRKWMYGVGCSAFVLAVGAPVQAGEILRPNVGADFTWQSTTCLKPRAPLTTAQTNNAAGQRRIYLQKVEAYIQCLREEAQRDFEEAQNKMHEAVEDALDTAVDEVNKDVARMARSTRY